MKTACEQSWCKSKLDCKWENKMFGFSYVKKTEYNFDAIPRQ